MEPIAVVTDRGVPLQRGSTFDYERLMNSPLWEGKLLPVSYFVENYGTGLRITGRKCALREGKPHVCEPLKKSSWVCASALPEGYSLSEVFLARIEVFLPRSRPRNQIRGRTGRANGVAGMPVVDKSVLPAAVKNNKVDVADVYSFVPITVLRDLVQGRKFNKFEAAVLFADASGFTKYIESLKYKVNGAELAGNALNDMFFSAVLMVIREWGGDVIKFSGDALTIVFPVTDIEGASKNIKDAVLRACQCSLDMQTELAAIRQQADKDDAKFELHTGLGAGHVTMLQVGGHCDRWEYIAAGPPLEQIAEAEPLAQRGETVLSPQAWKIVENVENIQASPVFKMVKNERIEFKKLESAPTESIPDKSALIPPKIPKEILPQIEKYIPSAISIRLISGQKSFIEEMRTVSIVFVNIPFEGLDLTTEEGGGVADRLMRLAQTAVYTKEGSVNKFLVDDKGITLLVVFGLPPLPHSDDPLRALLAGLRIVDKLKEFHPEVKVGVATDRVWCGVVGDNWRREYTVIGNAVNLCARLMGAKDNNDLLCDKNTYEKVKKRIEMQELEPIELKGMSEKVPIYRTIGQIVDTSLDRKKHQWTEEYDKWKKRMNEGPNAMTSTGGVVCVRGESGSGKTTTEIKMTKLVKKKGMVAINGSNQQPTDLMVRTGFLAAWEHVVIQILQHEREKSNWKYLTILKTLTPKEMWIDLGLLAYIISSHDSSDRSLNEEAINNIGYFQQFDIQGRRKRVRELLYQIIISFVGCRPCFLSLHMREGTSVHVVDDEDSWLLAAEIATFAQTRTRNMDCVSSTPFIFCVIFSKFDARQLTAKKHKHHIAAIVDMAKKFDGLIDLKPFDKEICNQFLGQLFFKQDFPLPPNVKDYVYEISGGNPARIICTEQQLRNEFMEEEKLLNGESRYYMSPLKIKHTDVWELPIHPDMVGEAMTFIERLPQDQQLLLKVSAALQDETFTPDAAFGPLETEMQAEQFKHHFLQLVIIGVFVAKRSEVAGSEKFSKWFRSNGSFRQCADFDSNQLESEININLWQYSFSSTLLRTVARSLNTNAQRRCADNLARKSILNKRLSTLPTAASDNALEVGLPSSSSRLLNVPAVKQASMASAASSNEQDEQVAQIGLGFMSDKYNESNRTFLYLYFHPSLWCSRAGAYGLAEIEITPTSEMGLQYNETTLLEVQNFDSIVPLLQATSNQLWMGFYLQCAAFLWVMFGPGGFFYFLIVSFIHDRKPALAEKLKFV
eukprot:gene960-885_t